MEKVIEVHSKLSGPGLWPGNAPVGGRIQDSWPQVPTLGSSHVTAGCFLGLQDRARFQPDLMSCWRLVEPPCAPHKLLQCVSAHVTKALPPGGWEVTCSRPPAGRMGPGCELCPQVWSSLAREPRPSCRFSGGCRAPYFLALPLQH